MYCNVCDGSTHFVITKGIIHIHQCRLKHHSHSLAERQKYIWQRICQTVVFLCLHTQHASNMGKEKRDEKSKNKIKSKHSIVSKRDKIISKDVKRVIECAKLEKHVKRVKLPTTTECQKCREKMAKNASAPGVKKQSSDRIKHKAAVPTQMPRLQFPLSSK